MTADDLIRRNVEYWADRGPKLHASTDKTLSAIFNPMFIQIAETMGWTKEGSLWVQPDKAKAWAWTDEQLIEHLKKSP
jgi:hypothetical protein